MKSEEPEDKSSLILESKNVWCQHFLDQSVMKLPPFKDLSNRLQSREWMLAIIAGAVGLAVSQVGGLPLVGDLLRREEWRLNDQIHRSAKPAIPADHVVVLGIDDASMTLDGLWPEDFEESEALQLMAKGWPWPRQVWAMVIERLVGAGARVIVLDLTFAAASAPEADAALQSVLTRYPDKVVLGVDHQGRQRGKADLEVMMPADSVLPGGDDRRPALGHLNFWPASEDGVVRTQRPIWTRTSTDSADWIQSLALATFRQEGGDIPELRPDEDRLFRFCRPEAFAPLSLHEILVESFWENNYQSGAFFADKTVFIGAAARHFQDELETPVGRIFGVQTHVHAYNGLRSGAWLTEASWLLRQAVFWAAVIGVWAMVCYIKRPFLVLCLLALVTAFSLMLQRIVYDEFSLVLSMLLPVLGFNLAGLFGLGYDFVLERRRRKDLMRYFSPDMAEELSQNPAPYLRSLGGVNRVITLLFSDLRGFTTLAESMSAQALLTQLNQYLDRMVQIVFSTQGSIDKFIGDAVMAVWGRVREDQSTRLLAQDAVNGIEAALRMREALVELNRVWTEQDLPLLQIGVGLHQGEAIVGNIGSAARMEFTAIGDSVNTAARLESLTKQYGVDLLVSQVMQQAAEGHFIFRTVDLVQVKGKSQPVAVFTVLDRIGVETIAGLESYEKGLDNYRQGRFAEASVCLEEAANQGLDDKLTMIHLQRCRELETNPPQGVWNGVFVATSK